MKKKKKVDKLEKPKTIDSNNWFGSGDFKQTVTMAMVTQL